MSTFNYNNDIPYAKDSGISNAPALLNGGTGASWLPGFVSTAIDRANYAATEGGAGFWAFGSMRTPQRAVVDWMQGFDPDVGNRVDPLFTPTVAKSYWDSAVITDAEKAAVMHQGGTQLVDEIVNNSVSLPHFRQRIREVEFIAKARIAIDQYDQEANMFTGGLHRTFSGVVNYVASDPMTTVSIVATAGMAAAGVGAASGTAAASRAGTIANIASTYNRTWKAATYLWDGIDGASSAYSGWKQLNDDGYRIYGDTYKKDDSWTDDVMLGSALGLGFSMGGDALGRMFNKSTSAPSAVSAMENMAANSSEGTLGTVIDHVAQSRFRTAKSRLETSLDTIVGPDSELRRHLMDDETRHNMFWGGPQEMDELSDWIEKNKPDADELGAYVNDRMAAQELNRQAVEKWDNELSDYVVGGGDEGAFFRKKSFDFLRSHMGDEFDKYRFVVDYLEDASGDPRLVAEWMARGDKDRVLRVVNAINANKRVGVIEDAALTSALKRISEQGHAVAVDEATQAVNRIHDNIVQGRFRGAVDILNEMHQEVIDRHGRLLGELDATINHLNEAFVRLNDEAFEKLDHFKETILSLRKLRDSMTEAVGSSGRSRRSMETVMDPDADNASVIMNASRTAEEAEVVRPDLAGIFKEVQDTVARFKEAETTLAGTLDEVKRTRRSALARAGADGLDRTMTESGSFPLWKVEMSGAGYSAVRNSAVRQTMAGNRWKVEFVDRFLGEGSADRALSSGSNPMRPIVTERPLAKAMTPEQQEAILAEELATVSPEIAAIRSGAADMPLDARIAENTTAINRLKTQANQAKAILSRSIGMESTARLTKFVNSRERLIKRLEKANKRLNEQLSGQLDVLNRDVETVPTVTPESLREARASARIAAHTKEAEKLSKLPADQWATKKGRNLRTKVRQAAAEMQSDTRYGALQGEARVLESELESARRNVTTLEKAGSTDADPALKAARDDVKYLEGQANKVRRDINAIDGRPAMIRRSHELNGNTPPIADVMEISRMRARIAVAVEAGDNDWAEELNRRLYEKYGDANRLPRWTTLEEFFLGEQRDIMNGIPRRQRMLTSTMDGRNVRFSVSEETADVAVREGVEDVLVGLPTRPEMSSSKGRRVPTETSRREAQAMRDQQMMESVLERDADVAEARIPEQKVRYENAAVTSPVTGLSPKTPTAKTASAGGSVEVPEPTKESKIKEALVVHGGVGERLLITNNIAMAMGRIPALRGLGRAIFRAQTAGTGFGQIHNSSRLLDIMVSAFNMLDRPEALVRSLGHNSGTTRTLQNFRDQGKLAVNELAVAEQRAVRAGHLTDASNARLQDALDSGDASALNPGERGMYDIMRRHYDEVGARLRVSHPGVADRPNYRPREANGSAILARTREAQTDFTQAYAHRMRTSGLALPDELADRFGIPRGTAWTALTPEEQATFDAGLYEYCTASSAETIARLTNGITEDGVGYRRAGSTARSTMARTLEDEVARDPRVRRWYMNSPVHEHKIYMEVRAPQIRFDAQLSEQIGVPCTFDDVISTLRQHSITITDSTLRAEFDSGVNALAQKWDYNVGRAQYQTKPALDAAFRTATGIVRGSFGAFWGLAGLTTEVPRAVFGAKMYGGSTMHGMVDLLHAIRRSNDMGAIEDIAHATDQYSTHAHSSFGSSVGTSVTERFIAPWERFWHVSLGREAVTNGGTAFNRFEGSVVSAAEAFGETGMRAGGMQYFSGIARVVADRQAKRFISRNIDNLDALANRLRAIGGVAENTPEARAAFRNACEQSNVPYDVAIQLNHSGLLDSEVLADLRLGLGGQEQVFSMGLMRGRVNDRTMGAMMDFLTSAHNFHVPTASLASSVESSSVFSKMFYNLTSYSRAFATNVAFRTAANGRFATMATTFAAVMVGENLYQSIRGIATGQTTPEKIEREWNDNPVGYFMAKAAKSPWLGAHNSIAMAGIDSLTGGTGATMRGNNIFGPLMQSGSQLHRAIFSDAKTGRRDMSFFQSHTPLFNTWYSRLLLGQGME